MRLWPWRWPPGGGAVRGPALSTARGAEPPPAERCLFVIGPERSTITALRNALNAAPDIFLLDEPDLHTDPGSPRFAARYNAARRLLRNPETKGSVCPPLPPRDGTWDETLVALVARHRYVGAGIALDMPELEPLFGFQCRYFYAARTVFTFRDPAAMLSPLTPRDGAADGQAQPLRLLLTYVESVRLFIKMFRNLPRVRALVHEDVSVTTFATLADWLGVQLDGAAACYDYGQVRAHDDAMSDEAVRRQLAPVRDLFADLRLGLREGFTTPQLDQNDANVNLGHYTKLGRLARQAEIIAEDLRAALAGAGAGAGAA